jgi:hypothetical protein
MGVRKLTRVTRVTADSQVVNNPAWVKKAVRRQINPTTELSTTVVVPWAKNIEL